MTCVCQYPGSDVSALPACPAICTSAYLTEAEQLLVSFCVFWLSWFARLFEMGCLSMWVQHICLAAV